MAKTILGASAVHTDAQPRQRSLPASAWIQHKALLKKMYIDQELPLQVIATRMASTYNFHASKQMYKERFAKWGLRKYYTRDQIQAALADLAHARQQGGVCEYRINGKPASMSRLRRSRRSRVFPREDTTVTYGAREPVVGCHDSAQLCAEVEEVEARHAPDDLVADHAILTPRFQLSRFMGQQDGESQCTEVALHLVDDYFLWYLTQDHILWDFKYSCALAEVFENLRMARHHMATDTRLTTAFVRINDACARLKEVFLMQPFQFLQQLVYEFVKVQWTTHVELRARLVTFIYQMSWSCLGMQHPITRLTFLLLQERLTSSAASKLMHLIPNLVSRHLGRYHKESFRIQLVSIHFHLGQNSIARAETMCEELLSSSTMALGPTHFTARRALAKLGWIYYKQGRFREAERLCSRAYRLALLDVGPIIDGIGIEAHHTLTQIYLAEGNLLEAESCTRVCVKAAEARWGTTDPSFSRHSEQLREILQLQGEDDGV